MKELLNNKNHNRVDGSAYNSAECASHRAVAMIHEMIHAETFYSAFWFGFK